MGEPDKAAVFDEHGLLIDPDDWSPELAQQLADRAGLGALTDRHWRFLKALREYYRKFGSPPPPHRICRELHLPRGCGHELFDTCLCAWRIAGLPDPGEEAKTYLSAD
jgi:tRNA 2-thiouridine synthesizing protein E